MKSFGISVGLIGCVVIFVHGVIASSGIWLQTFLSFVVPAVALFEDRLRWSVVFIPVASWRYVISILKFDELNEIFQVRNVISISVQPGQDDLTVLLFDPVLAVRHETLDVVLIYGRAPSGDCCETLPTIVVMPLH